MADDLLVRAAIRDELSGPLEEIRRELRGAGEAAQDAGKKAGRGARGFDAMAGGVGRLAKRTAGLALKGAAVGVAALGAGAAAAAVKFTSLASTAEETANVFVTVLGKGSPAHKAANAFVTDLGKSSGIATQQLQEAVGKFAVLGKQSGATGTDLAKFSTDLTQAALDLGSFYNASPEETIAAIQSGLTGEAEALKRFNIFMSDAALNAFALEKGLGKTTQQMTEQEKVALRQQFIMANLGDANGDLARTSDGFANRLRYLQGRLKEAGTVIGTFLLPYSNQLVTALGDRVGGSVEKLNTLLPALEEKVTGAGKAFEYLRNRFKAGGLEAVVGSLDNITDSGGKLTGAFELAKGIVEDVGIVIADVLLPAILDVTSAIDPAWLSPLGAARLALGFVADNADVFRVALVGLVAWMTAAKVITLATTAALKAQAAMAFITTARTYGLSYALKAGGVASKLLAAGTWLVNAAMKANPIGIVITALTLLVTGLVLAYKKSETFRDIVNAAFRAVGGFVLEMVDTGLGALEGLFGFAAKIPGPIGDAARQVQGSIRDARDGVDELGRKLDEVGRKKINPSVKIMGLGTAETDLINLEKRFARTGSYGVTATVSTNNRALGDTASSRARGAGSLGSTLAAHARYAGPGVKISNALIGGGGKGHGSGDHQAGRALDLVGSGLGRYAARVRADGGYAAYHGSGPTRHLHAVPAAMGDTSRSMVRERVAPASTSSSSTPVPSVVIGEGAIIVSGLTVDEARVAIADGIRDYVRDQQERS